LHNIVSISTVSIGPVGNSGSIKWLTKRVLKIWSIMCFYKKIFTKGTVMHSFCILMVSTVLLISGCAVTEPKGEPKLGMKYLQAYPAFVGGGIHRGLDLDVPLGTPVRAIADGLVVFAGTQIFSGVRTNVISIRHSGDVVSRYLHIDGLTIKENDQVRQGQQIAVIALNGPAGINTSQPVTYPHLHLEIYRFGSVIDPFLLGMTCSNTSWRWPVACAQ
jgi:hypothetical protein